MSSSYRIIFALTILCKLVSSQEYLGDACTLESSGAQAECKLMEDCPHAQEEFRKREPSQLCGFFGRRPIVCCRDTENRTAQLKPSENSTKNDVCTLQSGGAQGECKLLEDCPQALEELQKHNKFPQTCGFDGKRPIVCCPETEKRPSQRKPGEISKRKCKEYDRLAFETKKIDGTVTEVSHCDRVIHLGSEQPGRKEFPHMAAIGFESVPGEIHWLCGGTILNEKYILTAAHCLSDYSHGDAQWVKVGVTDLKDTSSHLQQIKIASRIPHPEYKQRSYYHDIGLIKLENPLALNPYARPACLHLQQEISTQRAIGTAWGGADWAGEGSTDKLQKVTLDLFDYDSCNASYKNVTSRKLKDGIVDDIQLCAGPRDGEKDTCQVDSGGPLQIYHVGDDVKCMYNVVGVASFGRACSSGPDVYTRVSYYVKWIEDIVWP